MLFGFNKLYNDIGTLIEATGAYLLSNINYTAILPLVNTKIIESFTSKSFVFVSTCITFFTEFAKLVYYQVKIVQISVDSIQESYTNVYNRIYNIKKEPTDLPWISFFILKTKYNSETKDFMYDYCEDYFPIKNDKNDVLIEKYRIICEDKIREFQNSVFQTEIIFSMKTFSKQFCTIYNENVMEDIKIKYDASLVRFLSIEYTHPEMKDSIPITISPSLLYEGNEILSKAFILRSLIYQPKPFVFSEDYVVKVIDSDVNQLRLKCNQYILLNKRDYIVHKYDRKKDE